MLLLKLSHNRCAQLKRTNCLFFLNLLFVFFSIIASPFCVCFSTDHTDENEHYFALHLNYFHWFNRPMSHYIISLFRYISFSNCFNVIISFSMPDFVLLGKPCEKENKCTKNKIMYTGKSLKMCLYVKSSIHFSTALTNPLTFNLYLAFALILLKNFHGKIPLFVHR